MQACCHRATASRLAAHDIMLEIAENPARPTRSSSCRRGKENK